MDGGAPLPNCERRTALARDVDVQRSSCRTCYMSMVFLNISGNFCTTASCKEAAPARLLEPQHGAVTARALEPQQRAVTAERLWVPVWTPNVLHLVAALANIFRKPTDRLRSLAAIDLRRSLAPIALRRRLAPISLRRTIALRRRLAPMALRRKLAPIALRRSLAAPIVLPNLRRRCFPTGTAHHHAAFLCRRFSYALLHLFRRRRRGATLATALLGRRPAYPGCVLLGTHAVAASPIP